MHCDNVLLRGNIGCDAFRELAGMNVLVRNIPEYSGLRGEGNRTD
jgi:hypothetical protein